MVTASCPESRCCYNWPSFTEKAILYLIIQGVKSTINDSFLIYSWCSFIYLLFFFWVLFGYFNLSIELLSQKPRDRICVINKAIQICQPLPIIFSKSHENMVWRSFCPDDWHIKALWLFSIKFFFNVLILCNYLKCHSEFLETEQDANKSN